MSPAKSSLQIRSRTDQPIHSLSSWASLGKPASDKHWKPGRSAYELARDWSEGDAPARATALLRKCSALRGLELLAAVAEKKTYFDDVGRGPRNHDLLVMARTSRGDRVVIAVEGKADEPFDAPLWKWRSDRLKSSANSAGPARLDRLTRAFFGSTLSTDHGYPPIACIGYQLISALAGLLADAKESHAKVGVLLIHEFETTLTEPERHAVNARVLDDFTTRLARGPSKRHKLGTGWITDPIEVRGSGERMPRMLPVAIAKLVTTR